MKSFADCWVSDKLNEECGVFGISLSPSDPYSVAEETYLALFALQHRGQESSGIATSNGGKIHVIKKRPCSEVFDERTAILRRNMAISHVR